jgi:hypothetical protein
LGVPIRDVRVLSIGTGRSRRNVTGLEEEKDWGYFTIFNVFIVKIFQSVSMGSKVTQFNV